MDARAPHGSTRSSGGITSIGRPLVSLRAAAMLLVVMGHACISYRRAPGADFPYCVYDSAQHVAFNVLGYWINGMVMPLFFLISGMMAQYSYQMQGSRTFLVHRCRSILLPFAFGLMAVLPVTYLLWGVGFLASGQCFQSDLMRLSLRGRLAGHSFGPMHLWFLEYLFLMSVGLWLARYVLSRCGRADSADRSAWLLSMLTAWWRPFVLAMPAALILYFDLESWIRANNSFLPNAVKFSYLGFFFTVGACYARLPRLQERLARWSGMFMLLSCLPCISMLLLFFRHFQVAPVTGGQRWVLLYSATLFAWLAVFGFLGLFIRYANWKSAALSYVSEASFWIYLCHEPVVIFAQLALRGQHWPAAIKFLTVVAIALMAAMATYEILVRRTALALVFGKKPLEPIRFPQGAARPIRFACGAGCFILLACTGWHFRAVLFQNNFHEVIHGQFYRSARVDARQLVRYAHRYAIRSVLSLYEAQESPQEKQAASQHGIRVYALHWNLEGPPSGGQMRQLVRILDTCPTPTLVHGRWGIGPTALASATAALLHGATPAQARRQFDLRSGTIGLASQAAIITQYQEWLTRHGQAHTPERFRAWVQSDYQG